MKRAIVIHGWGGHPEEGWRPWLRKELQERGFVVLNPSMPQTSDPTMEKWVLHLSQVIGTPDEDTYLIGHSLGCITILRYFETLDTNQKTGGTILVAGFSGDLEYSGYNGELSNFFKTPLNWKKIKKSSKKFISIHSDNDPWVLLTYSDIFKEKLGAKTIIQKNMKHFSGDDGITKLPIVLEELLMISKLNPV